MKIAIAAFLWASIFTMEGSLAQEESETSLQSMEDNSSIKDNLDDYTVQSGDTLWDISQRLLGSPWHWPKVWSNNPHIENPHWIYPGNQIRFDADKKMIVINQGSNNSGGSENEDEMVSVASGTKIGFGVASKRIFYQEGLVTQKELEESGVIDRALAEKEMLSDYDKVYLRFRNKSEVKIGQQYNIFKTTQEVMHPTTGRKFGFLTRIVGKVRIVKIDREIVSGVIEKANEEIHRGDFLGPLGNFEKEIVPTKNTLDLQGVILTSMVPSLPMLGENHMVFIDKGSRDGVKEGNIFSVIYQGDPLYKGDEERYPKENASTVIVVDVKETASAGLVLRSEREVAIGDRVAMISARSN